MFMMEQRRKNVLRCAENTEKFVNRKQVGNKNAEVA